MQITSPQVRLIDAEGGQRGVVAIEEARALAEEAGADLVMVAQKAEPPVVRIMDLGKHVYELKKKQSKQKVKGKGGEVKGVRISFKIGQHDMDLRLRQCDEFLSAGHKAKVEMRLRGREKYRQHLAEQKIREFIRLIPGGGAAEGPISRTHNSLSVIVIRSSKAAPAAVTPAE